MTTSTSSYPLGLAITKRYLDANATAVGPLLDWLIRLFALPPGADAS